MSFQDTYKITDEERIDKGVSGLPDTPGLTTADMQERFDSLANLSIDKFNAVVDAVSDTLDGSDLKIPTNKAVSEVIEEMGGGDMLRAVYDTDRDGVVDNSENALALNGHDDSYFGTAEAVTALRNNINGVSDDLELLSARVDNIIPSGTQTEGNTELIDIRDGFDGTNYESAGDAVRGQIEQVNNATISTIYNFNVTAIPSNSDLNDYLTEGNYKVTNGTVAATLANMPVIKSGRLTVGTINDSSHILQIYVTNGGDIYYRFYTTGGSGFSDWMIDTKTVSLADNYNTEKDYYYSGEFCFYNGKLYCRRVNGTPEATFNDLRWDEVKLGDLFYELKATTLKEENNLLFSLKYYRLHSYYSNTFTSSDGYVVFVVPVTANTTYYSNKLMRFVSKLGSKLAENVKQYTALEDTDLYLTFVLDPQDPFYYFSASNDFTYMLPYEVFQNNMFSSLQRNVDERNLLNHALFLKRGYYYNGSQSGERVGASYSYLIIPVESGVSYYIYSARMLSKGNAIIVNSEVNNYTYTADFTGNLYVTVYNNRPWIVSTKQDMSDVAPYNCPSFTEVHVLQTTGSDTRRPMSQKAVSDALAEIATEGSISAALTPILEGKVILQFGDSIMAGDGASNKGPGERLAMKYNMTVYDYAVGGATMGYYEGKVHIIDRVNMAINAERPADIILVNGGTNDIAGTTPHCPLGTVSDVYTEPSASDEFSNGFESVAYKIKSTWPEAMVIFIRAHNMSTRMYDRQISYGERGIEIAEKWGFGVIDMYKRMNSQLPYYEIYVPDHTHPNADGYSRYYIPAIEQYLFDHRNELTDS